MISRRLSASFGLLIMILIFVIAGLIIGLGMWSISSAFEEITAVEEPTSAAAYEMEINIVELDRDVLNYLDTGDERYREQAADDRADFEEAKADFDELVDTPTGREHADMLDEIYGEYAALAEALMDEQDEQNALISEVGEGFVEIDRLLDDELQANIDQGGADGPQKLEMTTSMEADVGELGTWFGSYLEFRHESSRQRVLDNADDFREELAQFEALELTEEERARANELEENFEQTVSQIEDTMDIEGSIQGDQTVFSGLQADLDDFLDDEVEPWTQQQLEEAEEDADAAITRVVVVLAVLILLGLLIDSALAYRIGRGIIGSLRKKL